MAEIFDLENTPKLLTGPNQHLFDIFLRNSICHNSVGISPIDLNCFMGHFESVFREVSFLPGGGLLKIGGSGIFSKMKRGITYIF